LKQDSASNILITTALTDTWGNRDQKAVLLGEWCKTLDNLNELEAREYHQVPYHWSDRDKFIKDYDYLELFYERVLQSLANSLNDYHGVDRSLRYWRILLGPWLLTYVAIAWDRWESLRLAFAEQDFDEVYSLSLDRDLMVPEDYDIFKVAMTDDHWNQHLFMEIIKYKFSERANSKSNSHKNIYSVNDRFCEASSSSIIDLFKSFIDQSLSFFSIGNHIVLVETFFDRKSLIRLSLKLNQVPRRHYEFSQDIQYPKVNPDRYNFSIDIQPSSDFEEFFQQHIFSQIPIAYLEGYEELNRVATSIKTTGDVIFTANAHLDNDLFNCWAGDQVEKGKKLIVSQHGGAMRSHMTNFDHQEKIADVMTVWHKPYMDKHVQLTPNKMIGVDNVNVKNKENITLLGSETCRYPYRAQAGPYGYNYMVDYQQKITFAKSLSDRAYQKLKIRSFNRINGGTRSKDAYTRDLGKDKISKHATLREAFSNSKMIVCTYPQTTFSEAMHSGIPTILLYSEKYWPLHPQFDDLIEQLKLNKIIFTDPHEAAEHINTVWDHPDQWWQDPSTQKAVNYFFEMTGRVNDDWVDEWVGFFASEF
jgi:putative transferase (TIGR04331 family)